MLLLGIIVVLVIIIIIAIVIIKNKSSQETSQEETTQEGGTSQKQPQLRLTPEIHKVDEILNDNEVLIIVNVRWVFYGKTCGEKYIHIFDEKYHEGIIPLSFICTIDNIENTYNNFKGTIKSKIFNEIQDGINKAYNFDICPMEEKDFEIHCPNFIKCVYNNDYLITYTNRTGMIEVYSKNYKYNYLNNSCVTIASTNKIDLNTIDNNLYAISFGIEYGNDIPVYKQYRMTKNEWISECNNTAELSYKNIFKVSQLYENKYINFAIILYAILYFFGDNININDFTININNTSLSQMDLLITDKPYCKGIYTYNDFKNSIKSLCSLITTFSQINNIILTIDINKNYESTITYYNTNTKKNINMFTEGDPMVNLPTAKISDIYIPIQLTTVQ